MKLVLLLLSTALSLKIYKSNLPLDSKSGFSGLKYINPKQKFEYTNSLTICGRFNYKRIGKEAIVFDIEKNGVKRLVPDINY